MKLLKTLTRPRKSDSWFNWVIAFSSMIVISGSFGIFRSSGVIYAEVIHAFNVDRELASWPFAISGVLNSFSGIVCGLLTTVLPVRIIVILGICASALGLAICYFTSSILWMIVGYGLFFGSGTGVVYVCLPMVINDYFKKNKTTANGILLAGTPLGVVLFAPLSEILITTYSLRGTFLLLSAVCVQTLVFAAFMKPAKRPLTAETTKREETLNGDLNNEERSLMLEEKYDSEIPYSKSENEINILEKSFRNDKNEHYVLVHGSLKSNCIGFGSTEHFESPNFDHVSISDYQKNLSSVIETDNTSTKVISQDCEIISSSVPVDHEIEAEVVSVVRRCNEKKLSRRNIFNLLKSPAFILMTFNFMVIMAAIQTITTVLVDYVEDKGLGRKNAIMLLTVVSISELLTRTCSGWITDKGFVKREYLLVISQTVAGAVVFAISLVNGQIALCVLLALFGICSSSTLVLMNVFCVDNFQKELLGFVFGIRHASMIFACVVRPWVVGICRDHFGTYDYMFQTVGGITAVTGLLWAFTICSKTTPAAAKS